MLQTFVHAITNIIHGIVLGVFIPLPGVLLALLVPDWGYVVIEYPQFLCFPKNLHFLYHSTILPYNILLAIGVSLLVIMFWKLHKVRIKC